MNHQDNIQHQIRLLIDNELNAEQTTVVLQHCEQNRDSWRMLALGMLESRELKAGLSELLTSTSDAGPPSTSQSKRRATRQWLWHGLVACLAVATFVAGLSIPRNKPASSAVATAPPTKIIPNQSVAAIEDSSTSQIVDASTQPQLGVSEIGLSVVGYAQILHQVGSEPPIPVITGPNLDYSALLTQERRIPEAMARRYRNEGLVVESQRRVMSLTLSDGQQFAIPLDQLGVRYVGNELL